MIHFIFLSAIVILSQSPIIVRWAAVPADALGFWRMGLASLLLLLFLALRRQVSDLKVLLTPAHRLPVLFSGFILFVHLLFWFLAIQITTVANSITLFSLNPVFTALGAWFFFQQKPTLRLIFSLALGILGMVVLVWGKYEGLGSAKGDLYALLSTITFSIYALLSKGLRARISNLPLALGIYSTCAFFFLVMTLLTHTPLIGYPDSSWWAFLAFAIGPTLLGHAIFTYCLGHLDINYMSAATLLEPALASISAYFIYKENLTISTIAGFFLICGAVLLTISSFRTVLFTDSRR